MSAMRCGIIFSVIIFTIDALIHFSRQNKLSAPHTKLAIRNFDHISKETNTTTFPVYIESTDAFGVMYYANYPVMLERSLSNYVGYNVKMLSAKIMKYKQPAKLGDIVSFKISVSSRGRINAIATCKSNISNTELFSCKDITWQPLTSVDAMVQGGLASPVSVVDGVRVHSFVYQVWPDEFGPDHTLTTGTVFNLFERARSDILGGPSALAELFKSTTHVYVTRVSDFESLWTGPLPLSATKTLPALGGCRIAVFTQAVPMGSGLINFIQQAALADADSKPGSSSQEETDISSTINIRDTLLARAQVLCAAVDSTSGQMTTFPNIDVAI